MEQRGSPDVDKPTEGSEVGSATRRLHKAEDEILRACLEDRSTAAQLTSRIPPERFLRPETRELAALIAARSHEGEWMPGAWVVDSDAVQTLLGRLAAEPTPVQEPVWLEKCASLLTQFWEKAQVRALTEGRTPTVEELGRIKEFYLQKQGAG